MCSMLYLIFLSLILIIWIYRAGTHLERFMVKQSCAICLEYPDGDVDEAVMVCFVTHLGDFYTVSPTHCWIGLGPN